MKLISSILILAGVFALNDASSVSFAEQRMRVASDKMKLEALREIETRDSQSVRCTSDYVDGVTKATNLLNSEIDECTNAMTKAKQEAETEAKQMVAQLGDKTSGSCSALSECLNIENAADALLCLNAGALDGSRTLSGVATDADTANIQMRRKIDAAAGAEVVCRDDAYAKYNRESVRLETILTDCLKGKTPAPTPAPEPEPTPAPEPAPTPAPEPEPTPAPEPAPTPAPEPAPESRRANKFQRF